MNQNNNMSHIAVLGCGAWATTIANHIAKQQIETRIWCHRPEIVKEINEEKQRSLLPHLSLSKQLTASLECNKVVQGATAIIICVPARYLDSVMAHWKPTYNKTQPVLSLIKGIGQNSPEQKALQKELQEVKDDNRKLSLQINDMLAKLRDAQF